MKKQLLKIITLCAITILTSILAVGCLSSKAVDSPKNQPRDNIDLTVYMNGVNDGDVKLPLVPVERKISFTEEDTIEFKVEKALDALTEGPTDEEKKEGLSTSMPDNVKVLNVSFNRPYITVNFSTDLQYIGGTMKVSSLLDQVTYTLTELDGIAGVILQVDGEQVGTESNPLSGEGFLFNVLSRPVEGEWIKDISPARALDNFIVSIGNGSAKEMWQWIGPEAKEYFKTPEELNITELAEGLGSWHDYEIVSEDIRGDKATVVIKGDQILEGMVEKDAQYVAYMIKENGHWKWDPWSKK